MGVGHQTRVLKTETVHVTRGGGECPRPSLFLPRTHSTSSRDLRTTGWDIPVARHFDARSVFIVLFWAGSYVCLLASKQIAGFFFLLLFAPRSLQVEGLDREGRFSDKWIS